MLLTGESLRYNSIKQCRLTALATPTVCPELKVQLNLSPSETGYGIQATISDENQVYMILKGQLDKQ
jgi:3-hydroxyacyl-[acyl-carrier-protein] dehydratase